ncbi:cation efflux protein [Fusarium solani]|uniref:Cation efflux protein n=1 Tax=Fusarium solani TaxID=169388 RepID=A0A9P9L773_FUSSL|nr:cation efflux protein [Fusarium solani]KAH7275447.1 cation efflux protein [Fusarium solani]
MKVSRKHRLMATICIAFSFFVAELAVGFYTRSLALVADAFHYLSDLIGIIVALVALLIQERPEPAPQEYTYGWQRATLLGAFFNGVFLVALSVSILVQAVERFIDLTHVQNPQLILIVGSVGLALNMLVLSFLHEHGHEHGGQGHGHEEQHCPPHGRLHEVAGTLANDAASKTEARLTPSTSSHHEHKHTSVAVRSPGRDLGMMGVFIHILGDAVNNLGVIIAALIIWKVEGEGRYYADPAVGVFIAVMIFLSAIPLVRNSGAILLQIAPGGISLEDVKHDIEKIPGIESVHELHIWRLDQHKSIASAHIVVDGRTVKSFSDKARIIMECLHAYGIHSATLQPEVLAGPPVTLTDGATDTQATAIDASLDTLRRRQQRSEEECQLICGELCEELRCCAPVQLQ